MICLVTNTCLEANSMDIDTGSPISIVVMNEKI